MSKAGRDFLTNVLDESRAGRHVLINRFIILMKVEQGATF